MSLGANKASLMGAAGGAAAAADLYTYQIANSCRFDGTASYLDITWGAAASDDNKKTISVWLKRSLVDSSTKQKIITAVGNTGTYLFNRDVTDSIGYYADGGATYGITTTRKFRDPSAWFHFVGIWDAGESNDYDRVKIYINGELFALNNGGWTFYGGYPGTTIPDLGKNGVVNYISRYSTASGYFNGYMADFIQIDGTAAISDFGETKNGVWIPKDPSGLTFGTNGFWLDFADSTAFGNDVSGNNNDWASSGLSTHDQMKDSPTFDSDTNAGNFCTFNPLYQGAYIALSEGNLRTAGASASDGGRALGTMAAPSGKWYWECVLKAVNQWIPSTGIRDLNSGTAMIDANQGPDRSITLDPAPPGEVYINTTAANNINMGTVTVDQTGITAYASDDILSLALDLDNRKIWYAKNNVWWNSGDPVAGTNPQASWSADDGIAMTPWCAQYNTSSSYFNFGADASFAGVDTGTAGPYADATGYGSFYYAPPTDFLALCAGNLPTPVADPAADTGPYKYFVPKLYTGDGAVTLAITGLEFQPDFTWIKNRDTTDPNCLFDSSRGATKLITASTEAAETTDTDTLKSWTSDGYTVGADVKVNTNTEAYASWNWLANAGTTSTNDDGSIDSEVQVDSDRGFSIMTYTGTGSGAITYGHGLGARPEFILNFRLEAVQGCTVFQHLMNGGAAPVDQGRMYLGYSGAYGVGSGGLWDVSAINSSTIGCISGTWMNQSEDFLTYAWVGKEGYSKFGTYEGNGNADGAVVYTGFRPAWIMTKSTDSTSDWAMFDDKRLGYNVNNNAQAAHLVAEATTDMIDILSNGFKFRIATDPNVAESYIYMAFAHNPFKYATAR